MRRQFAALQLDFAAQMFGHLLKRFHEIVSDARALT
jgi:hypothetical protein